MRTFTFNVGGANNLTVQVRRHKRQYLPDGVHLIEWFLLACAFNGTPIDMFPGEDKPIDYEAFGFKGKISQDVYENQGTVEAPVWVKIGTKRGADFRSRFFKQVVPRAARAFRAGQLGKTIGQLTPADISGAATNLRNACTGNFPDPTDLKAMTLDDAVKFLRDDTVSPIEEGAL